MLEIGDVILVKETEQQKEQKHLDDVLGLIKKKEKELDHSIEHAQNEAQNINSHFFDDVKLDYEKHTWNQIEDTSTCTEDGIKTYQCSVCLKTKK